MPPRRFSRHLFTLGVHDSGSPDELQLTDREPFTFKDYADNRLHPVVEGDTLFNLAARYFSPIENAASLWWVIADYQPDPIHDPTIALPVGSTLVIPSVRTVVEDIFNDKRADEAGL